MSFLKPYVILHNRTPLYRFSSNITYFLQKQPMKVQIFRFSTAQVKFHQISHVVFQIKSQFFFKVWVFLHSLEKKFFCIFLGDTLHSINKSSTSKCKFSELLLLALKLTKFLMSFLKPQISFFSNFSSLLSVMRHNSSVCFHLNLCMLWTKGSDQNANFQTFDCFHEN